MTVYIDPLGGVLLVGACVVGYFVHKYTARQEMTGKGDVVGAIVAATSVLTALVLIFGGDHTPPPTATPNGNGTPSTLASPPTGRR
ncbi:hypothetical protein ACFY0B_39160 [Streptomyces sp. NPDC001797]|uniref:hypothetical protein n=1 Tax=Streptomyces sp. NPDC001797 TaxID=3364610 RepID=UPI0036896410